MNSLYFYHFRSYSLSFLTILSLLLVLFIIAQSASFLVIAIEGGLSASALVQFLIHNVPVQIVDLAPICMIAAVAATSTQITNSGEFSVLRASGISDSSFFQPAFVFGLCLGLVYAIITLELAPRSSKALERLEARSLEQAASNVLVTPGEPIRIGNVELFAQEVGNFQLGNVSLFGTSETQFNVFVSSENAIFATSETGLSLNLTPGRVLRDQSGPIDVQEFENLLVDLTALTTSSPNTKGVAGDKESLRLSELLDMTDKSPSVQRIHAEELASRLSSLVFTFAIPTWILLWGLAFRQLRSGRSWLAHTGTITAFVILILLESGKASFAGSRISLGLVLLSLFGLGVVGPFLYWLREVIGHRRGRPTL